ncbi:hypothetical protein L249_1928, partial [Ophiocordyceps polyrhachis-furcata BCC 54312]
PPQRPESQWGYSGYSARSTRYSDRHSDRRAHPINLGTRQPSHRSARYTNSGHSARLPGFSYLIRDTNKLSTNFSPPSSSSTAPQNTSFDSTFPTLFSKHTYFFPTFFLIKKSCLILRKSLLPSSRAAITIPIRLCA